MENRTVDWTRLRSSRDRVPKGSGGAPEVGGLRERKKRQMRQRLSDTATEMFLDRGFDRVRVAEVAEACGVSEKTVYNYFPTKESLLLDRWDSTMNSLKARLADPALSPVEAALRILADELHALTSWIAGQEDTAAAVSLIERFGKLIGATPALRAHQRDMTDQLVTAAAEILARRGRLTPSDPEPQIAATALLGLWQVQSTSLTKHLGETRNPVQLDTRVGNDVARAARIVESGLMSFPVGDGRADAESPIDTAS